MPHYLFFKTQAISGSEWRTHVKALLIEIAFHGLRFGLALLVVHGPPKSIHIRVCKTQF